MRVEVRLQTDRLKDILSIPIFDAEATMDFLEREIYREYHRWHSLKVYEFDLFKSDETGVHEYAKKGERVSTFFSIPEKASREFRVHVEASESMASKIRRAEDTRQARIEELKAEKKRIQKEIERRERIVELLLAGECWNLNNNPIAINVPLEEDGLVAQNLGSLDRWCCVKYNRPILNVNRYYFSVKIEDDPSTTNSWRICVGIVPASFNEGDKRCWVGSDESYGYIAGTGGKCHQSGKSSPYGESYGQGDVIGCFLDFEAGTIEFFKNNISQGVAFNNLLRMSYFPAVSLTATGSSIRLVSNDPPPVIEHVVVENRRQHLRDVERWREIRSIHFQVRQAENFYDHSINSWDCEFSAEIDYSITYPQSKSTDEVPEHIFEVVNGESNNKWRCIRTIGAYTNGQHFFEVEILRDTPSTNLWRIAIGAIPEEFTPNDSQVWIGAQKSWSYVGGVGGKCYNSNQTLSYAEPYSTGDKIGVFLDLDKGEIEYFLNGVPQGVAFSDIQGRLYGAVSLTGTGARVKLINSSVEKSEEYRRQSAEETRKMENIVLQYGNIWNDARLSSGLTLEDKIVVYNEQDSSEWQAAVAKIGYASGRQYVEFEVLNKPPSSRIIVGVVEKRFNPNSGDLVGGIQSWGYDALGGLKVSHGGKREVYGQKFGTGDIIGVLMDFENQTVDFFKNGASQGTAFEDLQGKVFPSISILGKGVKIKLNAKLEKEQIDSLFLYS